MLKFLYTNEVFREIPGEISLGISISGCQIHCKGCHSRELWEDAGNVLDINTIDTLLSAHKGITCLLLMGGEHDIDSLIELFQYAHSRVKTAWYCGLDMIPKSKKKILNYLDYYKIGHYDQELGGLDSPTTNQRLYKYEHNVGEHWKDITNKFWKNEN